MKKDIIETSHLEVACQGESPALGHPKVYLHIEPHESEAVCPYCNRLFLYKPAKIKKSKL